MLRNSPRRERDVSGNTPAKKEISPVLPEPVITYLDTQYPERAPNPADSEREVWMKAGERRLVRRLITEFKRQTEDPI